jgi:anti-anti-sigma factor
LKENFINDILKSVSISTTPEKGLIMEIQEKVTENGILFLIKGSLSGTQKSTIKLFEQVSAKIESDNKGIVIDLREVTFIDSMSIGLLVGVLLKSKEHKIPFNFQNIPHHISQIFEATQLKRIFPGLY